MPRKPLKAKDKTEDKPAASGLCVHRVPTTAFCPKCAREKKR
jgi:hypothetical protein